jgi:hypothetical protein
MGENLRVSQNLNRAIPCIDIAYFGNLKKVPIYLEYDLENDVQIISIGPRLDLISNYNL